MTGWQVSRKEPLQPRAAIFLAVLVLWGGPLFALDATAPSGATRHEVITLTHITPERGKEFLSRLKIGTVSQLGQTKALLVTAEPKELQKAVTILNLVDTRTEFDVRQLCPASAAKTLPTNAEIADAVGGLSIGTFAIPPQDRGKMRAIVDVHDGAVVAIAPVFQLQDIRLAVELGPQVLKQRKTLVKPGSGTAVPQMIQATAMADASKGVSSFKPQVSSELQTLRPASNFELQPSNPSVPDSDQPKQFVLPKETQQRLPEIRERATELEPQRLSVSQSNVQPEQAAPAADRQAAGNDQAPVPPNAQTTEPSKPAEPQPTGENRPAEAVKPAEPAAQEPAGLQPGQVVPSAPAQTTQPQPVEAKPQAQPQPPEVKTIAATAAPQTKAAASRYEPAEFPNGDEIVDLVLQERMPIIQLLDLVGKKLNLSYVYNPDEVKGEVCFKLNGELKGSMKVKHLYLLLESVLKSNNLITTRHKGNIVTVAQGTRAIESDPTLMDPSMEHIEAGDTVVTRSFELKHIDTASATNLIKAMQLAFDVTPISERSMMIVTAYAHRMERVERLLQIVDQPGKPRKYRFRQLKYTMAKTLAEKVKALAEQLQSVSVTVAEPDISVAIARTPGESDIAYRTRLAQIRAAQTTAQAQARALAAARGQAIPEAKPGVYLDADERTNRVLMIGGEEQLAIVEELVNSLDVEQQDLRALRLYPMKFVDAEEVARKLQELGIISKIPETSASSRITGSPRIQPQLPGQPRSPTTPGTPEVALPPGTEVTEKGLVEEPQVVVVESTNSLLVNATAEQHAKIVNIIEYVDSEMLLKEIPYKIYQLENSSPGHLAEVFESLIQETVEQEKDGKMQRTVISRDDKIKIVPDPNTYSLIVYANKKNQEWISNLVQQLDKRRPQVLIDVTLVEVAKTDNFNYELSLIRGSRDLASTSAVSGIKPGADSLGKFIKTSGGAFSAFYGDDQIQALLQTMESKSFGRVLAKPKLLVNDNQKGIIETKDTTYVEETSAIPVTSGAAGTATNLIQTSQTFKGYEAGITLDITPHISEGELLQLKIVVTRSDFLPSAADRPPDTRTNQVDTAVTLPNGGTVILGGLLKMNQTKGGSRVPILGNIPIIGGLFRTINNEDKQSKLYVFVKAEIIRAGETAEQSMKELQTLSDRDRMAFEKHELEFQRYEDWPGIKPKRVDPAKVLDAQ